MYFLPCCILQFGQLNYIVKCKDEHIHYTLSVTEDVIKTAYYKHVSFALFKRSRISLIPTLVSNNQVLIANLDLDPLVVPE